MKIGQDVMLKPDAKLPARIQTYAGHIGTVIDADHPAHREQICTVRFADGAALLLCDSDLIKLS